MKAGLVTGSSTFRSACGTWCSTVCCASALGTSAIAAAAMMAAWTILMAGFPPSCSGPGRGRVERVEASVQAGVREAFEVRGADARRIHIGVTDRHVAERGGPSAAALHADHLGLRRLHAGDAKMERVER